MTHSKIYIDFIFEVPLENGIPLVCMDSLKGSLNTVIFSVKVMENGHRMVYIEYTIHLNTQPKAAAVTSIQVYFQNFHLTECKLKI